MLIIFDLDDTLVTTTLSITPIKMRDALYAMVRKGFYVPDFEEALTCLKQIDQTQETFRDSLAVFGKLYEATIEQLKAGEKEFYENISPDLPLNALEDAHDVLKHLAQKHRLALVTRGFEATQKKKLEKAGIDPTLFSRIVVLEKGCKGESYALLLQEFKVPSQEVFVCGDRISIDLSPAKKLGLKTVHIRSGRGLFNLGNLEDVDYTIHTLNELVKVIET